MKCPICCKELKFSLINGYSESPHFPFCSEKCKMVDLYNWINGYYYISEEVPNHEDEENDKPEKFWVN